ncbi:endonuclease/exonuclease/phosphatase family domain-containing protein 1-like [Mya arenaria]|uniref:endonuclease/exonuclease/phosphatase family domain-containing protein 1-like n=1 Tax=Mya arenaria TaxID=6604 RepID=UPI0022E637EC|nr:endonuclease/exonuclease/phosphatase family domain-containing protein 1-like [Mya arenaria]XP_052817076.1 endonuclease/exonuclease/phosphatase family domain-containing protein 1-like [Mya arenaria]XP_052817077.1 endonuclease/exonuclease/phosphatase family domain-containing protein 1-like [Mya arenaria]XP_052817079.1 endonuclease/exonuclease/phosphatase family domain-containing protein 1-like [Mya arenaria]XP_052817080.1 endonuclease/exonuclease/phosphatase family domain-containing protein 1-
MGAVNSCCIPRKSGIEEEKVAKNGFRKHKRQLSAAFNMTLLDEENKALVKNQLDINTATEEELMTLPGINRVTAKQIVDYRRQIRGFKLVEDLALVSGVGAVRLEAIRHEIIVNKKVNGNGSPENGRMSNKRESSGPRVVNLNTANVFQLMKVKGIGQTLAENIVTYRDKKGHFTNIDDLIKVKGIGHHVLSAIKPQLTLDENVTSDSVSYSSSKKSSNLNNSAIPSRTSDISLNSENNSINPPNECSKGSLENLLETLGPFSEKAERPAVDFPTFKCNNRGAVRVASWNLQCFSSDKALNPGVKDVVCMTILENGFSIIAVQELADQEGLQKICDELNAPTLPNVTRWAGQRGKWKCIVSESTGRMYMSNEYNGFLYDESQGISLISSCLLAKDRKQKPFTRRPFIATFKIKRFDCAMVSVHLKATGLDNEDLGRLQEEIDKMPNLVAAIQAELPGERDIILLGDFNLSPDAQDFNDLRNIGYHNCIAEGVFTNISEANKKGSKTYDNIWLAKQTKQVFTGNCGVIREGLTSPWIPAGWKWGGVVSDHCPIWAQLYTGKDLDTGDIKIGTEAIRFALGND